MLAVLAHELVHVDQYQRNGYYAFTVAYKIEQSLDTYDDNIFEREASSMENLVEQDFHAFAQFHIPLP